MEVVTVGAVVALAAFAALGPLPTPEEWRAAVFFAAFGVVASALAYRTSQVTLGSIGFLPSLSLTLVAPNVAALAAVFLSATVGEMVLRRAPMKALFNVAQSVCAVGAAILGYRALGGQSLLTHSPTALPFLVMGILYFSLNKLAVSTVVSAAENRSTKAHWIKSMRDSLVYDLLAFPLILFFAVAYVRLGAGWSAMLALPMLGIRQLYRTVFALQKVNEELLQLMVASIEARDPYTSGHSQRVSRYSRVIAKAAGFSSKLISRTEIAALLHDVGKIHEEFATILRKPGHLTEEEFDVMKTHPQRSAELVGKVSQFSDLVPPVLSHHEAWDGSGYPNQVRGKQIPIMARVIALADTIDAMTTSRPYRSGLSVEQVRLEIRRVSGQQFDPEICARLLEPRMWAELETEMALAQSEYPITPTWEVDSVQGNTGEFLALAGGRRRAS